MKSASETMANVCRRQNNCFEHIFKSSDIPLKTLYNGKSNMFLLCTICMPCSDAIPPFRPVAVTAKYHTILCVCVYRNESINSISKNKSTLHKYIYDVYVIAWDTCIRACMYVVLFVLMLYLLPSVVPIIS